MKPKELEPKVQQYVNGSVGYLRDAKPQEAMSTLRAAAVTLGRRLPADPALLGAVAERLVTVSGLHRSEAFPAAREGLAEGQRARAKERNDSDTAVVRNDRGLW
jgi:hypothetical protein